MNTGNLMIQVRTANDAVPIECACVRIWDSEGRLLYELATDDSGETPLIHLETVSKELSLNPNYTGMPYTSYDVAISAGGFNNLYLSGVHIFDNETAIQPEPVPISINSEF